MASSSSSSSSSSNSHQSTVIIAPATSTTSGNFVHPPNVISRKNLQNLAKYVDPNVQLDEEVEDLLLAYSDEFMEQIMEGAAKFAAHRKGTSIEPQDLETYLERHHNMWISTEDKEEPSKAAKKTYQSEAHKQRMALIKKTLKKY